MDIQIRRTSIQVQRHGLSAYRHRHEKLCLGRRSVVRGGDLDIFRVLVDRVDFSGLLRRYHVREIPAEFPKGLTQGEIASTDKARVFIALDDEGGLAFAWLNRNRRWGGGSLNRGRQQGHQESGGRDAPHFDICSSIPIFHAYCA